MTNWKSKYKNQERYHAIIRGQKKRWRQRTGSGQYKKRPWTPEDEQRVLKHKIMDRELSQQIKRSVTSIQYKRHELKERSK